MKKMLAMFVGAAALVMVSAVPAAAQDNELGVAFSCQKWNSDQCGSKGFAIDFGHVVHKAPTSALSIIVDFSRNRFADEETDMGFVAGVRERFLRDSRVSPFVQGTAGIMRWKEDFFEESGNDFIVGGGGGVQIKLSDMIDAKAEVNIWGNKDTGGWDVITRLSFGAVIKLGAKK